MSALTVLRRAYASSPLSALGKRYFAGHAIPKPDTSLDHVFGSDAYTVKHDFGLYPTGSTFFMTVAVVGFMSLPVLLMVQEDNDVRAMEAKIAAAKAAKAAA